MLPTIEDLAGELHERSLPGGEIVIEKYEAVIGDQALRATPSTDGVAHPIWFVIASLRGIGITVDELCAMMHTRTTDTLLFGSCSVVQDRSLRAGERYRTTARIGEIASRTTRDGSRLDSVEVEVGVHDDAGQAGSVSSTYLFKRGDTDD